jgi:hypothetical protein
VTIDSRDNVTQPNPYLFDNGATNFAPMNPNPNDLGRLTFENSTRYQLRTLNCTHDGFCTGEGGPTIEPVTNYIPQEQLDKKRKEKEQQRQVSHIAEGFSGGREAANEPVKPPSSEFATFIPRATASSNAREHLTMRRQ